MRPSSGRCGLWPPRSLRAAWSGSEWRCSRAPPRRPAPAVAPRRVVLLKGGERLRHGVWEALAAYLEDPVAPTCLVCVADKLDAGHRGLKRIDQAGKVLRFSAPRDEAARERHCQQWMSEGGREAGKCLTPA